MDRAINPAITNKSMLTFRTDFEALKWLLTISDASKTLVRWRLQLLEPEWNMEHRVGSQHQDADEPSSLLTIGSDKSNVDKETPVWSMNPKTFGAAYSFKTKQQKQEARDYSTPKREFDQ